MSRSTDFGHTRIKSSRFTNPLNAPSSTPTLPQLTNKPAQRARQRKRAQAGVLVD
jgi:hypothetical protein